MFPPSIRESVWWSSLISDEPQLWRPDSLGGFKARIRFSISGHSKSRLLVRIDELADGQGVGRFALLQRTRKGLSIKETRGRSFRVSSASMNLLHARIKEATLWEGGPETQWVHRDEGLICIDGYQMIFESVDARGYRLSEANAQCSAPSSLLALARHIIDASGDRSASKLIDHFGLNE